MALYCVLFVFCKGQATIGYTVESRYLEVDGTTFYKFNLPEVQINLHSG